MLGIANSNVARFLLQADNAFPSQRVLVVYAPSHVSNRDVAITLAQRVQHQLRTHCTGQNLFGERMFFFFQ